VTAEVMVDFVARHKIHLLFPPAICALECVNAWYPDAFPPSEGT
jgi:hypothetical protein